MAQTYLKLMTAAWGNSSEEVKHLTEQGVDVNEKNGGSYGSRRKKQEAISRKI